MLSEEVADVSPRGQEDTASSRGQSRRPSEGPREDWLRKAADAREKDSASVISLGLCSRDTFLVSCLPRRGREPSLYSQHSGGAQCVPAVSREGVEPSEEVLRDTLKPYVNVPCVSFFSKLQRVCI